MLARSAPCACARMCPETSKDETLFAPHQFLGGCVGGGGKERNQTLCSRLTSTNLPSTQKTRPYWTGLEGARSYFSGGVVMVQQQISEVTYQ